MKSFVLFVGLLLSVSVSAEPLLEGQVRLESGQPVANAQVRLFDLTKLHQSVGTTTDETGHFTLSLPTSAPGSALPQGFALGQNYPNPFNPSTIIPYQIPTAAHVRLEVFNVLGQRVATLVDAERPAGFHAAKWDATDATGQAVGAGVYFYRLVSGGTTTSRRMVLIDGQAGSPAAGAAGPMQTSALEQVEADAGVYGLTVSGAGVVAYVNPAFRVGVDAAEIVLEAASGSPRMKRTAGEILGDVNNDGQVNASDALYISLYSRNPSITLPNNGDITLGDLNKDGWVDLTDAKLLIRYLADPSDPSLPAGIGEPVGATTTTTSQQWKLYWTDTDTDKIQRANLDGSHIEDLVTRANGLRAPTDIALDVAGGKIYWADLDRGKIQRANLDGSRVEDLVTRANGLDNPYGIALDVAGGKIYWTDITTDKIQRANLDGSNVEDLVTTGLSSPRGIALDVAGGKIYWTDAGTSSDPGKIQRANLNGSNVEDLVTTGLVVPVSIALDVADGKMYWTDVGAGEINRANLDGGRQQIIGTRANGLRNPYGIALDVADGKMYWTDTDTGEINRANLDGGRQQIIGTRANGLRNPFGIALGFVPVEAVALAPLDEQTFNSQMVGKSLHAETFFLDFVSAGRFSEDGHLPGSYSYSNTGSNTGLLTLTYDGGQYGGGCTFQLTFASATTGTLTYTCDSGDEGQATWRWRISEIGTPLAPIIASRSVTNTRFDIYFPAFFEAGETRAYDFQIRTKLPQGSWVDFCNEFTNTEDSAGRGFISQRFGGLSPGTVYEVRYRYRNSSRCGAGTPGSWSEIGEGTTSGGGGQGNAGGTCFVGQELRPGQSCTYGSNTFRVTSAGQGCVGGICAGTGLYLNDFSATRSGDTWTIVSVP